MNYKKITPRKELQPFVESIWIQEDLTDASKENYLPTRIIPTTKIDMLFYYGDPFVQNKNGKREVIPKFVLHGQMTKPLEVSASGKTGIIIVSFYPWGTAPFFKNSISDFTDASTDLSLVFGQKTIREFKSKFYDEESVNEKVRLIQDFLINNLDENNNDKFIEHLVKFINCKNGNVGVVELAKELKISRRHLNRRFTKTVGISSKQFASIIRFQKAMFYKRNNYCWADVAELCNYFDQPHFIKEIKRYTGYSPGKIFPQSNSTNLMDYFNLHEAKSHFYNTIYI